MKYRNMLAKMDAEKQAEALIASAAEHSHVKTENCSDYSQPNTMSCYQPNLPLSLGVHQLPAGSPLLQMYTSTGRPTYSYQHQHVSGGEASDTSSIKHSPDSPLSANDTYQGSSFYQKVSPNSGGLAHSPQTPCSTNGSSKLTESAERKRKSNPYIPSYMDPTNGPEPCVVCTDAATGYHYRCMTCEGCKGFFRRTIQKNLVYSCKWNGNCVIDKNTRNQCQKCRYEKCIRVGMATDLVLNEKQRVAKRRLIEENRAKRKNEDVTESKVFFPSSNTIKPDDMGSMSNPDDASNSLLSSPLPQSHFRSQDYVSSDDRKLIDDIQLAYDTQSPRLPKITSDMVDQEDINQLKEFSPKVFTTLTQLMTPAIRQVVEFAKAVPGFGQLEPDDQTILLKGCCLDIICLRAACRFDRSTDTLILQSGMHITQEKLASGSISQLIAPIYHFAVKLAKLELNQTEIALLAAVLLMTSDRSGIHDPNYIDHIQERILGAFKRYQAEMHPNQQVHWARTLMTVTELRTISTRHAERVLAIRLDSPEDLPPLFLELFGNSEEVMAATAAGEATASGNAEQKPCSSTSLATTSDNGKVRMSSSSSAEQATTPSPSSSSNLPTEAPSLMPATPDGP